MRIALLAVVAALVGCGGTATSSSGTGGSPQAGGGMPNTGGSSAGLGGRSTGGAPGAGGSGGNAAGGVPTDCGTPVIFRLAGLDPSSESSLCLGKPGSCSGGGWLEVRDPAGQGVILSLGCHLTACSQCQLTGCPATCAQSTALPDEGVSMEWNRVRWMGGQTCGADNLQCATPDCAPPGSYSARFCAYELPGHGGAENDPNTFDLCELNASTTPTCVDVPFELPGAGVVEGVIEPKF